MLTEPNTREFLGDRARAFLVGRVTEQAMLERAPLSETEKRILSFSARDVEPDFAAVDAFNDHYNKEEYEQRIIKLVRRAHAFDQKHASGFRECSPMSRLGVCGMWPTTSD